MSSESGSDSDESTLTSAESSPPPKHQQPQPKPKPKPKSKPVDDDDDDDDLETVDVPSTSDTSDSHPKRALAPADSKPPTVAAAPVVVTIAPSTTDQKAAPPTMARPEAAKTITPPPQPAAKPAPTPSMAPAANSPAVVKSAVIKASPPKPKPKPKPAKKVTPQKAPAKPSIPGQLGRYASTTESVKQRLQATQKKAQLLKGTESPEKQKKRGKPKSDSKFVLGKRVDEICQHESAAFASHTPRDIFADMPADTPPPGAYTNQRPVPQMPNFPPAKERSRDHPAGFGSTCPRDSIYTLTNGSHTYRAFEKLFFDPIPSDPKKKGTAEKRRQSAPQLQTSVCGTPLVRAPLKERPPVQQQFSYERMSVYSSFQVEHSSKSAAWAKSTTPRLPIEGEPKQQGRVSPKKGKQPDPPPAKPLSAFLDEARKQVERHPQKLDHTKPAFGSKSSRDCMSAPAPKTPPPGSYEIP